MSNSFSPPLSYLTIRSILYSLIYSSSFGVLFSPLGVQKSKFVDHLMQRNWTRISITTVFINPVLSILPGSIKILLLKANNNSTTTIITYRWKIHSLTSRSSPPLWHAHLPGNATHRCTLICHPINCHVSIWLSLIVACCHHTRSESFVIHILNPRHCGVVYIWFVSGIDMIDSDLHFNGFVRIEHIRLESYCFTVWVPQWWNMRHVTTSSLERKS